MVHGGSRFRVTALINADARSAIADLAPLHQPRVLADIDATEALLPGVPAVACFDTAFHAGLSEAAATYALPMAWPERFGLRHYGFHGLSHGCASRCAAGLVGRSAGRLRMVPCHPGAGGCLPPAGRSTPRASRLWRAGDMRDVQATAGGGDHDVRPALGVYLHRLRREIPPWAGRTFWCSPAGSVSRSRRACRCRHRAGFPRRRHRRRQQQRRAWRRARPARSGSCVGLACGHVLHSRLLRLADQYPGELQSPTREFHGCDQTGRARSWMPGPAQLAAVQATDTRN